MLPATASVRGVTAGYLTDPAVAPRAPLPDVPSSTTWVAALVTAGVLVLLFSVLIQWVGADHGGRDPERPPDTGPFRALVAVGLATLAAAAGVNLGAG